MNTIKLHQVTSSYQKEPQTPQNKQKNLRNFGHNIVRSITLRKLQEHGITQFLTTRRFLLYADIEVLWVSAFLNACLFVLALVWSKDASNLIRMISWYMGPILYPEPKKHSSVIPNPKLDHSLRLRGCDQNGTPALLPRVFPNFPRQSYLWWKKCAGHKHHFVSRFVQNFTTAVNIRFRNSRGWTVQFLQHICRNNNTLWVWWIGKSKICNWFNPCEMDTYVIHGCRCPYLHAPWSWNTVDWKSIWGGQFPWNQKIDHDVFHLISHKLNVACRQRMMFSCFKPKWNIVWNFGMVRHEKWIKHNWFCEIWPHCYQTYFAHGARHAWLQCGWQV